MDDLIRRQAILDMLEDINNHIIDGYGYKHDWCVEWVNGLPTIDAVPVIRCKDCKWYGRADKRRFYRGTDCLQKRIDTIVPERDFCSRAERKE